MPAPIFYTEKEEASLLEDLHPLKSLWECADFKIFSAREDAYLVVQGKNVLVDLYVVVGENAVSEFKNAHTFEDPEKFVWERIIEGLTPDLLKWLAHATYRLGKQDSRKEMQTIRNRILGVGESLRTLASD